MAHDYTPIHRRSKRKNYKKCANASLYALERFQR